ncbi:MAG: hypothetical protein MUF64_26065 [Polyangiaceae bacterium]|jgi:hypothetical protein|nr:hypothetical protein [Polyangiaceae bacterium]
MNSKNILLVEGPDDMHVLAALLNKHATEVPDGSFVIKKKDGKDPLLAEFPLQIKARNVPRLGVLMDADSDLSARWLSLRTRFEANTNQKLPEQPEPSGTVVTYGEGLRFGVWLMPNNQLPGILEDFVAYLIPQGDVLLQHTDHFLSGLPERRFPDHDLAKARIHVWLSIQKEPEKTMGQAITAKALDGSRQEALALVGWLRRLFVDPDPA